jgi:hypothetical protein
MPQGGFLEEIANAFADGGAGHALMVAREDPPSLTPTPGLLRDRLRLDGTSCPT